MDPFSTMFTDPDLSTKTELRAAFPCSRVGEIIRLCPMLGPASTPSTITAPSHRKHYNEDEITVSDLLHIVNSGHSCVFNHQIGKDVEVKAQRSGPRFPSDALFGFQHITVCSSLSSCKIRIIFICYLSTKGYIIT